MRAQALLLGSFRAGTVRYTDVKGRGTAVVRFNSERDAQRAVGILCHQVAQILAASARLMPIVARKKNYGDG